MDTYKVENLLVCEIPVGKQHLFDAETKTAICGRKNYLNNPQPADVKFAIIWCENCAKKVAA